MAIQVNIPAVVARNLEIVKRISMDPTEPLPGPFSPHLFDGPEEPEHRLLMDISPHPILH